MTTNSDAIPSIAEWTGYLGLVPFLAAFVGVFMSPVFAWQEFALRATIAYGAAVLTFVGAVHFGLCVAGKLAWSVPAVLAATLPSVVATVAVLVGGQRGVGALVIGFGMFWLYESRTLASQLNASYLSLRRNLSLAVCALLALTMFAAESAGLR